MSIKDNLLKIKSISVFGLIFVLVAVFSFGLGRLVNLRDARTPIVLGSYELPISETMTGQKTSPEKTNSNITPTPASIGGEVVASKNGKTYHLPTCSGAKNISPENKIIFATRADAQKAGYSPAKNCKGL